MPVIELETRIKSDIETCFDLARSIDLHRISTANTNEKSVAGRLSGLIEAGEFVTWQATHFLITQKLTSKITAFTRPFHFRDEQQKGAFSYLIHDHYFSFQGDQVLMRDFFSFQSPFGFLGKIVDRFVMTTYLSNLLIGRNKVIKAYAETDKWKNVLVEK